MSRMLIYIPLIGALASATLPGQSSRDIDPHSTPNTLTIDNRSDRAWMLTLETEALDAEHTYVGTQAPGQERDITIVASSLSMAQAAPHRSLVLPAHSQPFTFHFPVGQWPGPIIAILKDHQGHADCRLIFTATPQPQGPSAVTVDIAPDWGEAQNVSAVVHRATPNTLLILGPQFLSEGKARVKLPTAHRQDKQPQPRRLF